MREDCGGPAWYWRSSGIQAYEESIRLNPSSAEAWYNKGVALKAQGKLDEAIQAYDEAIKINPQLADAWNNKGIALKLLDRDAEAQEAYAKARELGYPG